MTSHCMPWVCLSLHLLATPGMCSSAQPRTHLCTCWWPLAWRGAPSAALAWPERHELWAVSEGRADNPVVVCRMRTEWDIDISEHQSSAVHKSSVTLQSSQQLSWELSPLSAMRMGDVHNNNTQSIADYLAQLLKDKKQLAAFPNVFIHMERLLDEGELWWCITGLGMLLHPSVILDTDVTNKGVILKNYSEQFLLSLSSRRHRACLSPAPDQVWCRQRAVAWWRWGVVFWSLSRHYFHLRVNGCMRAWAAKRACIREYSESYHNLTNGNNNTHRVIQSGHSESWCYRETGTGSDEMGSVIPSPAPVTYLTSSSRPEVLGINTWTSGMRDNQHHARESLYVLIYCQHCVSGAEDVTFVCRCQFLICPLSGGWGPWHRMLLTSDPGGAVTSADVSGSEWVTYTEPQLMFVQSVHMLLFLLTSRMRCGDHREWAPGQNST